jgi:hypothetical protein
MLSARAAARRAHGRVRRVARELDLAGVEAADAPYAPSLSCTHATWLPWATGPLFWAPQGAQGKNERLFFTCCAALLIYFSYAGS